MYTTRAVRITGLTASETRAICRTKGIYNLGVKMSAMVPFAVTFNEML
jgi:hypothetical protein